MKDKKEYKIGVISDTHGLLRDEVRVELTGCDYIIHGGDINKESILEELKKIAPLYVVRGNNDKGEWAEKLPEELYFTIENVNFYMIHNKKYASKNLENIDIVIFGHSHKYFCEEIDNVLWLNPGSCGKRRFDLPINMSIIKISCSNYNVEKIDIVTDNTNIPKK